MMMIRNLKATGTVLLALFAMSALFSSVASAQFESEAEHTVLTVSSNETQLFTFSSGGTEFKCHNIEIHSTVLSATKRTTAVTVEPTYSECDQILGASASIDTNGCHWLLHLAAASTTGTTDIECEGTKGIELTVGSICKYKTSTQTGLSSVTYKNTGSGTTREIDLEPHLTGITWTRTTNDLFCPSAGTTGTYRGVSTITGENTAGQHVGIWVD